MDVIETMDAVETDEAEVTNVFIKRNRTLDDLEPSGTLDQMVRQTRIHHAQLSQMADVKASMLLTLASLIMTFSIGYLSDPVLRWPVVIMLCACVVTILSAAYAVMPKLNLKAQPHQNETTSNILFFANFLNMDYEEFAGIMNEVMHDPTLSYEAMLREVYEIGIYLGHKKYRYIRIGYTAFLVGVVLSVLALIITEFVQVFSS